MASKTRPVKVWMGTVLLGVWLSIPTNNLVLMFNKI